jgi:hypothetical protein
LDSTPTPLPSQTQSGGHRTRNFERDGSASSTLYTAFLSSIIYWMSSFTILMLSSLVFCTENVIGNHNMIQSAYLFTLKVIWFLAGMVILSPMTVAPVCDVGDPVNLTCTASVEFIRWNITVVNDQGIIEEITANSNSGDASQQMSQRVINSTTFIFMRSSAQNGPLVSTLSIDSVSIGLNGTVVRCVEVGGSMASASSTIHIIGGIKSELN